MAQSHAPLRVAIVGAGPSGFFAAEALQKAVSELQIDLYDRLLTPYGLVRGGVAPDHPKIRSVTKVFDRIAGKPGFRFLGNVEVGRDISIAELRSRYHAVIITIGAAIDRALDIPGENLPRSHAATTLVGWYNGHPDFAIQQFDFSQPEVAVVGMGNVAMDIARMLLTPPDLLSSTDIADYSIEALRNSRITRVHLLGRRGPVQAACTTPELRELGEIPGVDVVVDPRDLELDSASQRYLEESDDRTAEKNLELLRGWANAETHRQPKQIVFHFAVSPSELYGTRGVESMQLSRNNLEPDPSGYLRSVPSGEHFVLPVGLVFRAIGYHGTPLEGVPFDPRKGVIPTQEGRVLTGHGETAVIPGLYAAGWIKRGPSGVIGTNKACAATTVEHLLEDVAAGKLPAPAEDSKTALDLLRERGVRVTDWNDWLRLDELERLRGSATGKPRSKLTSYTELIGALDQ